MGDPSLNAFLLQSGTLDCRCGLAPEDVMHVLMVRPYYSNVDENQTFGKLDEFAPEAILQKKVYA